MNKWSAVGWVINVRIAKPITPVSCGYENLFTTQVHQRYIFLLIMPRVATIYVMFRVCKFYHVLTHDKGEKMCSYISYNKIVIIV